MHLPAFLEYLIQATETVQRDRQAGRYTVESMQTTTCTVSLEYFLLRPHQCRSFLSNVPPLGGRLLKIRDPLGNCFTLISLPGAKILKGLLQTRSVPTNIRCLRHRTFLAHHIANVCTISASLIHQILGGPVKWKIAILLSRHALRQSQVHTILGFCPKPQGRGAIKNRRQAILAA
jgi:hypothetical protein